MNDQLQEIFHHLRVNRMRTLLTGLSVTIGIFLLILLLGAGNGLINAFKHNQGYTPLDVIRLTAQRTTMPYKGLPEGRSIELNNADVKHIERALPLRIRQAVGSVTHKGTNFKHHGKMLTGELKGVTPLTKEMAHLRLSYGRFINDEDLRLRRKSIVIGAKLAREFYGTEAKALHQLLTVDQIVFRIVGIQDDNGVFYGLSAYIPLTTLQLLYTKGDFLDEISLRTRKVEREAEVDKLTKDLSVALAAPHNFSPQDVEAINTYSAMAGNEQANVTFAYLEGALWVLGLLTLLSGVAGVSNIMLITVKERTHEFGIRKALGARSATILRSVLMESIIITLTFGYVGMLLGIMATEYLSHLAGEEYVEIFGNKVYTFLHPKVALSTALYALGVLIVAGIIAGLLPALKAIRMKPIDALRAE